MKKKDVPQDAGPLKDFSKELLYTVDEKGQYETSLSKGWKVKEEALDTAWADISKRIQSAKQAVLEGKASPILYFMEKNLMDIGVLASYTGLWRCSVKRHLKMHHFKKLSDNKLKKYAKVFEIDVADLKNFKNHAD